MTAKLTLGRRDILKLCLSLEVEEQKYRALAISCPPEDIGYIAACKRHAHVLKCLREPLSAIIRDGAGQLLIRYDPY